MGSMSVFSQVQMCGSTKASFTCKLEYAKHPLVCNYCLVFKTVSQYSNTFPTESLITVSVPKGLHF